MYSVSIRMTATHAKDMSFTIPDFLKEYAEDGDSDTVVVLYAIVVRGNLPTSVLSYESTKVLSYNVVPSYESTL